MTAKPTCSGLKTNGLRCTATIGVDPLSLLCRAHDPARREEMQAARAAGGRIGGRRNRFKAAEIDWPPKATTLEEARRNQAWISDAILQSKIASSTGKDASYALKGFETLSHRLDVEEKLKAALKKTTKLERCAERCTCGAFE